VDLAAQPPVQVFAQGPGPDQLDRIAVRRGHEAHVHASRVHVTQGADLPFIEDAQQLGLVPNVHGLEFVEEEEAVIGGLEQADALLVGAREGALAVSEEDPVEELGGREGAVVRDERGTGLPELVDRARDEVLACSGPARQQDGLRVAGGDPHGGSNGSHRRTASDDSLETVRLTRPVVTPRSSQQDASFFARAGGGQ
jgi:hypothetical protein